MFADVKEELTSIGSSNHCSLKVGSGSGGNKTGSFGVAIAGRGGGGGGSATQKSLTFKCGPHQVTMEASSLYFPWLLNDILNPGRTESLISWNSNKFIIYFKNCFQWPSLSLLPCGGSGGLMYCFLGAICGKFRRSRRGCSQI
jgi:hypothetical protein